MKKLILFMILLFPFYLNGQTNITKDKNCIIKQEVNSSDFSFLDSLLKDKRIVLLGENKHTHGASITTINKMIRYLHNKLNYDVLLIEDGMYRVMSLDNQLLKKNIYWPQIFYCHEGPYFSYNLLGLYKYIDSTYKTTKPLRVFGSDLAAFEMECDSTNFSSVINEYLLKNRNFSSNIPILWDKLKAHLFKISDNKEACMSVYNQFIEFDKRICLYDNSFHDELAYILLRNYIYNIREAHLTYKDPNFQKKYPNGTMDGNKCRDSLMALTTNWLLTKGPLKDKKVIMHFSAWHISNNITDLAPIDGWETSIPMFQLMKDSLKKQAYSICFINKTGFNEYMNGSGTATRNGSRLRPEPEFERKLGLEAELSRMGYKEAFVDLSKIPNTTKFFMSPTFKPNEYYYNWSNVYSGAYFIHDMEPMYLMLFIEGLKNDEDFRKAYINWIKEKNIIYFDKF